MKKVLVAGFFLIAALLMSGLAVSDTNAQVPSKPASFSIGAGFSVPTGDLGDAQKLGFHGAGRAGFNVAPKLNVLAGVDYHTFSYDNMGVDSISGGTYSALMFGGDLQYSLATPTMSAEPYILAGVGFAIQSVSDLKVGSTTFTTDSFTDLYAEFGAGVEFNQFFVQGRYVLIFADGSTGSFLPFTVGVKF